MKILFMPWPEVVTDALVTFGLKANERYEFSGELLLKLVERYDVMIHNIAEENYDDKVMYISRLGRGFG